MAKNTLANSASIEARLRIAKPRFKKAVTIANVWPLYQLASELEMECQVNTCVKQVHHSEIGDENVRTVGSDLNRATVGRTKPLPRTETDVRMAPNMFIITLVKSDLSGYILKCVQRLVMLLHSLSKYSLNLSNNTRK